MLLAMNMAKMPNRGVSRAAIVVILQLLMNPRAEVEEDKK
jgi:hypothetical protein